MLRRKHINEARILQNVDPKLKASMSSMLSNLNKRGESSENQKPLKKDSPEVLLQKYIIGLLKTGSECPETVEDINRIGTFKLYGQAYIDGGGSISDIQNMYVDNGGTIDFEIQQDFPPYEEPAVDVDDEPQSGIDFPKYDDVQTIDEEPIINNTGQEDIPINKYTKSMFRQVENAEPGDYIVFDENEGLIISDERINAICICVAAGYNFIDNMPRFMYLQQEPAKLGIPGNKGKYEDFYFRAQLDYNDHYEVIPGNKYHYKEGANGLNYTKILLGLQNGPAIQALNIANKVLNRLDPSSEETQSIAQYLKNNTYLPTLFELSKAFEFLDEGKYWTSSVTSNGSCNIAYEINNRGDMFIKGDKPDDIANVAAFVKI